jgi:hypothetical protein
VAVVGARRIDGGRSTDSGVAFVYERSNGRWTKQAELTPGDGVRDDSEDETAWLDVYDRFNAFGTFNNEFTKQIGIDNP